MLKNERNTIKKYPYLSSSPNLLDFFLVLGYNTNFSKADVSNESFISSSSFVCSISETRSTLEPKAYSQFQNKIKPTVLSSIPSKHSNIMLDEDLIINFVFPSPPQIYFYKTTKVIPSSYTVVFESNSDTIDGKGKNTFNGIAYIYYEKRQTINKEKVYLPKALCLISQFPFFTTYYNILHTLIKYYESSSINLPIEIIIYNLLNFLPSPLYNPIITNLFGKPGIEQKQDNVSQKKGGPLNIDFEFAQLSGYPYFDFNLIEVFKIMNPKLFVNVFLFFFLEIDMLFFSENLETLNMVLYIFSSLTYPLSDTTYQWHIISVSKEELIENGTDSKFVSKNNSSLLGVNCAFTKDINVNDSYPYHFIVDLDKNQFFFKYRKNLGDKNDIVKIRKLNKFLVDLNIESEGFLAKHIVKLVNDITIVSDYQNPSDEITEIPKINFFTNSVNISKKNKAIQELFYKFILDILSIYYPNFQVRSVIEECAELQNEEIKNYFIGYNKKFPPMGEIELFFFEMLGETCKLKLFFVSFIKNKQVLDLFEIPYIFAENFLHLKQKGLERNSTFEYLRAIDNFYLAHDFHKLHFVPNNPQIIDFSQLYIYYKQNLQNFFLEELANTPNTSRIKQMKIEYYYKYIDLNLDIIFKYDSLLSHLSDEKLNSILPFISTIKNNQVKNINPIHISNCIEIELLRYKIFKRSDLIIFSALLITGMVGGCCNPSGMVTLLMKLTYKLKFCYRKYLTILISIYYSIAESKIKNLDDSSESEFIFFFGLFNFGLMQRMLPDKNLLCYYNKFSRLECLKKQYTDEFDKSYENNDTPKFEFTIHDHCGIKKSGANAFQAILKSSDNILYEGNIGSNNNDSKSCIYLNFKNLNTKKEIRTPLFSPLKLYKKSTYLMENYLDELKINSDNMTLLIELIVNIRFYLENLKEFTELSKLASNIFANFVNNFLK